MRVRKKARKSGRKVATDDLIANCTAAGCKSVVMPGPKPPLCYFHITDIQKWYSGLSDWDQGLARGLLCVALEQHPTGLALYREYAPRTKRRTAYDVGPGAYWLLHTVLSGIVGNAAYAGLKVAVRRAWSRWNSGQRLPVGILKKRVYERLRLSIHGRQPPCGRVTPIVKARIDDLARILLGQDGDHASKR